MLSPGLTLESAINPAWLSGHTHIVQIIRCQMSHNPTKLWSTVTGFLLREI